MEPTVYVVRVDASQVEGFEQILAALGWSAVRGVYNENDELEGVVYVHGHLQDSIFLQAERDDTASWLDIIDTTGRIIS